MRNPFGVLLTLTAVFGIGVGLAFGGGVLYGRNTAKAAPAPAVITPTGGGQQGGGAGAGGGTGQAGGGQQGQGQAAGAGAVVGAIEKVEGNVLTVRTQQGAATVNFTAETDVRQSVPAQAADLQAGEFVTAQGTRGADGAIQARTLTIGPAPAAGGGQGGRGQGQGQGTPAAQGSPAAQGTPAVSATPGR
jgi:hypothetical protein